MFATGVAPRRTYALCSPVPGSCFSVLTTAGSTLRRWPRSLWRSRTRQSGFRQPEVRGAKADPSAGMTPADGSQGLRRGSERQPDSPPRPEAVSAFLKRYGPPESDVAHLKQLGTALSDLAPP